MKKISLLLIFAAIIVLQSCSDKNKLSVINYNFTEEAEVDQNLVFTFDKDLVPDSMLDQWVAEKYLEINPTTEGRYKWNTPRELMFAPAGNLFPSTAYSLKLTKEIVKHASVKYSLGKNTSFNFKTPDLKFIGSMAFWGIEDNNPDFPFLKIKLDFNYEIAPADIQSFIKVVIGNKERKVVVDQTNTSKEIILKVKDIGDVDMGFAKCIIRKGFKLTGSKYITEADKEYTANIPDKGKLEIVSILPDYVGTTGIIHVYTSQSVLENTIKPAVKLAPKKEISFEITESGFDIKGEFAAGESYELILEKTLRGALGGKLEEEVRKSIYFGELSPTLSFANSKALYLSSAGERSIGVNIINIPKVKVEIVKIYENNILAFLRSGGEYYDEYNDEYNYGFNYVSTDELGDVVYSREIETANLKKVKGVKVLDLHLEDKNVFKGIYLVKINNTEDYYMRATKVVSISDIGFIVRKGSNSLFVMANSIRTTQPLSGVKLNLISSNNQNVIQATTGSDGVAVINDINQKAPGFNIAMVTANNGQDFNYIHFNSSEINTARFDVGGLTDNAGGYQAFLYGDRDIYRPGETVNINAIVRNEKWDPIPDLPVKIRLLLPNGKEMRSWKKTLNSQGACEINAPISASSITGGYTVELFTSNDVLLASKYLNIEEFMPDRIKVAIITNKDNVQPGDELKIDVQADNLFGTPAANRNFELNVNYSIKNFSSKSFPGYTFDLSQQNVLNSQFFQGVTSEKGTGSQSILIGNEFTDMGVVQARIFATVFDENGRPVNRVKSFDIYTQKLFFGIGLQDYYFDTQSKMNIPLACVDKSGKGVKGKARVQIVRSEWQSVVENSGSGFRYVSRRFEKLVYNQLMEINGSATIDYVPTVSGQYEVRVMREGSYVYTTRQFYSYGWGYASNTSFEVDNEGNVDITTDKESYQVGETAKVLFKAPFKGKMLVTIERNKVFQYFVINTDSRSASLEVPVKDEFLPNFYISATLIKPNDPNASIPLTVAHGYANVIAEKSSNKINVQIDAVEKSRSKAKQIIHVKTSEPNAELTIALVDEGILQLKNYKTPDPYGYFYARRALQVSAFDVYPWLFPELSSSKSATGGDGYDLGKRVNPFPNKRVNLVAFWSGIMHTDGKGNAEFEVAIPQFSGDVRIMAVCYKNKSFGSATRNMKVADPVVISAGLPRFVSPGDEVLVPVTVSNTTSKEANCSVSISSNGATEVVGENSRNINLKPNAEAQTVYRIKGKLTPGTASVTITVNGLGEKFTDITEFTVRPPASLQKLSGNGTVNSGSSATIDFSDKFINETRASRLFISKSPVAAIGKQLGELLGYPHGCVEQTISKAFPQIYLEDLVKAINTAKKPYLKSGANELNPTYNVQEAIRKLESMQMYNGGMSYWPGSDYESWWGSIYAAHFFVEARQAGYEVNNQVYNKLFDYINEKLRNKETEEYYYSEPGTNTFYKRKYVKREMIYGLYVLALDGKARLSLMNYYKNSKDLLTPDAQYMLATTFYIAGDANTYRQLCPSSYPADYSAYYWSSCYYSPLRNEAIALNCLVAADPNNAQIPDMARHLSQAIQKREYLSTQEAAFSLLALGKLARKANNSNITANVTLNGKSIGNFNGSDLTISNPGKGNLKIETKGSGSLYYFWETEGLTEDGSYKQEDNYLKVRKVFLNRFGNVITNNFKQNDLVVVKISINSMRGEDIENVVITDMLPAGFEIENPRITESQNMPWIKNQGNPQYSDYRDDRINLFVTASPGETCYYYLCRAVTKGTFKMGPVSADAMYNWEYHSYHGAATITID